VEPTTRRVTLGRIVGVFGVRGQVKVQSFTRPAENLLRYKRWWIASAAPYEAKVTEGRPHGGTFVVTLADAEDQPIEDRDVAAKLIGIEVQVERSALPKAPKGSYYWADLIGLNVKSISGVPLGAVTDLIDNGAQDVLIVEEGQGEGRVQRMIPFVKGPIIHRVDLEGGEIIADWEPDY
jgi:16S rRNA processing protein RimM